MRLIAGRLGMDGRLQESQKKEEDSSFHIADWMPCGRLHLAT
jgi:hypothetical protein